MAKIAVELEQLLRDRAVNGRPGSTTARRLAEGEGWTVADVICTCGPGDRPFEEQHSGFSIAIVLCGSFQYQGTVNSGSSRELMTPGSVLLGNAGHAFECGHEHGEGDRCLSFGYSSGHFERIASDIGIKGPPRFRTLRLPPVPSFSPLIAAAQAGLSGWHTDWEELGVRMLRQVFELSSDIRQRNCRTDLGTEARLTRVVRKIERSPDRNLNLGSLAREAVLSPYHFLRVFERVTGLTPHQYVLRARLRNAASQLTSTRNKVLDVALDAGFGDVSTFNRAFRAEFRVTPLQYRRAV